MKTNTWEEQANEICNHFFGLGATISKKDYDYVLLEISNAKEEGKIESIEKNFDEFLHYYYNTPCSGCKDGHASMWKTITESPQWKEWEKVGQYDFSECNELGIMTAKHFQDFLEFIKSLYQSKENLIKEEKEI
jgi:hypothetical protein